MTISKRLIVSALPLALVTAAASVQPAAAQDAGVTTSISAGAKVTDASGGDVGTISKVDGQFVILKTDKHEVRLPVTSFRAHNGSFLFGMSRDQLNAEVEKTLAAASAKMVAGASVTGSQGGNVGTIEAIDDQFVTVSLTSGKKVRLPRTAVAPGPNGAVIGMTVAQLEAAAGGGAKAEPPKDAKSK